MMSPGVEDDDVAGHDLLGRDLDLAPSRMTAALIRTERSSFSTASAAPRSCQKPSRPLARTIARMIEASTGSRRKKDSPAAKKRIRIMGLLN